MVHFPRPWKGSFSSCRIFLDLSLSESRFSLRSDLGIARNLNSCEIIFRKCANPFRLNFPACCSIKYCCKTEKRNLRLYKLCALSYSGANAPVRVREPPAGPKKLSNSLGESTFPNFWGISPDLKTSRSQAAEFSWTSRFQNLKLQIFNSRRYIFYSNRRS